MSRFEETRLVLAERIVRRDRLHGTWWPRTNDIATEVGPMLALISSRVHNVLGMALNRADWPGAPMLIQPLLSRSPKISWYGLDQPHLALLHASGSTRIALLLLPPDTPEEVAVTVMQMTTTPGNCLTTTETLARAYEHAGQPVTSPPDRAT